MLPVSAVVPVSVIFVLIFVQFLISVCAAMVFMVCVASVTPMICRRCSAAVTSSVTGLVGQAASCFGVRGSRLIVAPLHASGAQGVEEKAFVGAPQRTFQPDREEDRTTT